MQELLKQAIENFRKKQDKRFLSLKNELKTFFEVVAEEKQNEVKKYSNEISLNLAQKVGLKLKEVLNKIITKHSDLDELDWSKSGHKIDDNFNVRNNKIVGLGDAVGEQDAVNVRTLTKYVSEQTSKIVLPSFGGATSHNNLRDIKGGDYHLTEEQHEELSVFSDNFNLPLVDGTANQVLTTDGSGNLIWTDGNNITNHSSLTGLEDDDHTQYALLDGRIGGQTLIGGTNSGDNLTLQSTSNATKGKINFGNSVYDEANNRLGIGIATPTSSLHVKGSGSTDATFSQKIENSASSNLFSVRDDGQLSGLQIRTNFGNSVFLGEGAGLNDDGGDNQNVGVGIDALRNNTSGYFNTANGYASLYSNTTGYQNTASGRGSLYSNTIGFSNTANGHLSLFSNTSGYFNTANGYQSLRSNTTGHSNTANGYSSLFANTTGYQNTANGYHSLFSNTTGFNNTANGFQSLQANTTGNSNTANGFQSLYSNTTGYNNTANGHLSLYSNTSGFSNTANGYQSLAFNTIGNNNTANGYNSGNYIANGSTANETSSNSVYIGANTKALADGGTNEIVIGYDAIGEGSNTVRLGNTSITNVKTSGTLTLDAVTYPKVDGTVGQVLTTNGSGVLSFENTGALLDYGEMYQVDNAIATIINTVDVWEEVDNFIAGELNGITFANSDFSIVKTGKYHLNVSLTGVPVNANRVFEFAVSINDVIVDKVKAKRNFSSTTDSGSVSLNGIVSLTATDVVKLEIRNVTDATNFTIQNSNFTLNEI